MTKWSNIVEAQDEEEWFTDIVRTTLASPPPGLPSRSQRIGAAEANYFLIDSSLAFITTAGGSPDDRLLARCVVKEQLAGHGIHQAQFTFDQDPRDDNAISKTATWDDIMAKSKRLIQSGQVQLLRNGAQNIIGQVQGDHGTYQTELSRDDPNSNALTQWSCSCPWDQYSFQRTRKWKKYEARPCSHVLATWWSSQATPLDEDAHPANQQGLFNAPAAPYTGPGASPFRAPVPDAQGQQMQIPGMFPGQATGTPPGPSGAPPDAGILPQFPMDPALQPQVNPASVPGLKQPSPTNPMQYPGGTFSSISNDNWQFESSDTMIYVGADFPQQPEGFASGNMISTKYEDWGTYIGRSDAHGSGQPAKIPAGSVGEVLSQDPTTKMINVLFENKLTEKMGPLEPNGITAWYLPSELTVRPDVRRPGPAVRRR